MKAIAILTNIRNLETDFDHTKISSVDEALEELEAYKAKIESLKELCSEKSKILDDVVIKTKYQTLAVKAASNKAIYDEILQKLEELDK